METESQWWTDSQTDEDSDAEEIMCGIQQGNCATDLCHHPQLETDIQAVKTLYSNSAVSVRLYGSIDDVDVDLNMNANFLDKEVAKAWRINPSEPIVIRLHFSLSQYLDGPAPSVEVFQPSNADHFSAGKQIQSILTVFISREWGHLTNENIVVQQKRRHSWFRPSGTIKKFRARLSVWSPLSKSNQLQEPNVRGRIILPAAKRSRFTNHATSYSIKSSTGELINYTLNGKRVMVSAVRSSAQLSSKQLIEIFSSQAVRHCKTTPTLQHGFLVQIMRYAKQRLLTLNEYCVICDERHVFQNGPMLKPAVCTRELCVFSFYSLGVMAEAAEEVATGAEVIDLLVAMCRAALQSSRKSIIFDPYPSFVDPHNPKALAFSPNRKSYERLQRALDSVLFIRRMAQGPHSEIRKNMLDKLDPLAFPLLQWIIVSNRSHIVKLPPSRQLKFMHTPHQFLLVSSPPSKEARFQTAKKLYGSTFAFHGSPIENWHSILRNGLVNASHTKLELHGAAYGKGIYLSPISSISFGYSGMGKGQHQITAKEELLKKHGRINKLKQEQQGQDRFLLSRNLSCIALCEVITSKDLQKHVNIWVCPISDHVCTRFLFVYENGQVGGHINTQEDMIHRDILQVIASKAC